MRTHRSYGWSALVALTLGGAFACDEDTQVPRADFRRPTGMAYVERPETFVCPSIPIISQAQFDALTVDEKRLTEAITIDAFGGTMEGTRDASLLVADSEAEGVRVQQFRQDVIVESSTVGPIDNLVTDQNVIVPGPTVFFPLVLSSPGFPTRVAFSKEEIQLNRLCAYLKDFSGTVDAIDEDGNDVLNPDGSTASSTITGSFSDETGDPRVTVDDNFVLNDGTVVSVVIADVTRLVPRAARGFVLSSLGGALRSERVRTSTAAAGPVLYVIDTRPRPFDARSSAFEGFAIQELDLGAVEHTAGPWTTVDMQVVDYIGCEPPAVVDPTEAAAAACDNQGADIVAVLQSPIGDSYGRLVFITIPRDGSDVVYTPVRLPNGSPENMIVLDDRIMISNSASDSIFEVLMTVRDTDPASAVRPGVVSQIDVDGPTNLVIDGDTIGVFASRLDVSRLVHLRREGNRFVRSTERLVSPFEYEPDPDNAARLGVLDLRDSRVVAAKLGRVEQLLGQTDAITEEDLNGDLRAPVVLLAHADGQVRFVLGSPPRVAIWVENVLFQAQRLQVEQPPDDLDDPEVNEELVMRVVGCDSPQLDISTSEDEEQVLVPDPDGPVPACYPGTPELLDCNDEVQLRLSVEANVFRAAYRGALVSTGDPTTPQDLPLDSSPSEITVTDIQGDPATLQFDDTVFLQAQYVNDDEEASTECSLVDTNVIFNGRVIDAEATDDTTMRVRFAVDDVERDVELEPGNTTQLDNCGLDFLTRFEVYPSGDEVVYTRLTGSRIIEVLQRVPAVLETVSTSTFTKFSAVFAGESIAGEPLDLQFKVEGALLGEDESNGVMGGIEVVDEGRICSTSDDCGPGFECQADEPDQAVLDAEEEIGASNGRSCLARCRRTLEFEEFEDQFVDRAVRRPGVQVVVRSAIEAGGVLQGGAGTTLNGETLPLPADVVFSPMRRSWLISIPASRALAEIRSGSGGIIPSVIR